MSGGPAFPGRLRQVAWEFRGYPAQSWPGIAELYRGWQPAMLELVERIMASPYAAGLFGLTSHGTLYVSQFSEVSTSANVLRIEQTPEGRIRFEFIERHDERHRWTRESAPEQAFATFERFLQLQNWFVRLPPGDPPPS